MPLQKIYTLLFYFGLFFIPFNEFEGFSFLGEYQSEAAGYFFLSGFIVVVIDSFKKGKINYPINHPLMIVLLLFLLWTVIATLINFPTVLDSYFKQTSGLSRYFRQTFSLLISAFCFPFLFWNVIKNYDFEQILLKIRTILLYSFMFVALYGFIEIAIVYFGMGFLLPVLKCFDYLPFVNTNLSMGERVGISSVTFEIPALGNYLIFVTPWLLSYIFTHKSYYKYIPSALAIILMLFSDARAAFVIVFIQLICFIIILLNESRYKRFTLKSIKIFTLLVACLVVLNSEKIYNTAYEKIDKLNFSKNLTKNVSNKSRFGMQYAALQVFSEHPICGVGFGQGTYHMMHHYPYWATNQNWEFTYMYKNQKEKSFPPQYNMYTRLLAELGIIGFLLFSSLMVLTVLYSFVCWRKSPDHKRYIYIIFLLSFIGFSINWLQSDFFRHYGFWLILVLLIKAILEFPKIISTTDRNN